MPTLPVETKLPSIFSAGFSQANVALYIVPSLVTTKNSQLPLSLALLNHKVSSVLGSNATHLPSFSLAISLTSPILRDTWSSLSINLYSTQVLPSCGPSPPVASHVAVLIALSQSKVAVYTLPSVVFTSYSQLPVAFSTLNHRVASVLAVRSFHSPSPTFTLMQSTLSLAKEMSSSPATSLYSAQILPAASPALSGAMPTLPVETKLPSIFSAGFSQANVALYIVPSLVTTKNSQLPLSLALLNHKVSSVLGSNATHLPSFSLAISLTSPILRDTWSSLSINLYSTQVLPSCGPSPPVASHVAVLIALSQSKVAVYTLPSVVFTSYSQLPVAFSTLNHRVASVLAVRSFHSPSPTFTLMQSTLSLAKEMSSSPATSLYSAQILPAASPALSGAMPTLPVETKLPSIFSAGFSQANVALYIVPSLVTTKNSQLPLSLALLNHKVSSVLGSNATHLPSFSLAISLTSPILRDTWSSLSINLYSTQVLPSCGPSPPVASHVAVLIALSQSKVAVYTLPSVVFTSYSQLPVAFSTLNHRVASVLAVRSFHSPSPTFTLMQSTLSLAKEMSSSPATSLYSAQILPAASPALSGAMPTLPVETKLPSIFSAGFSQANVALYIVPSLVTTKNSQLPLSLALLNHKVSSVLGSNATHLPSFSLAISLTSPILRDTWSSLSINLYSTQVLPSCGPSPPVASHVAVLIALSQSKVAVYTLPSVVFTSYSQLPVAFSTLNHRVASVLAVRSFHSPSPTFTLMQSTLSLAKEMSSSPATSLYSAQILPAASPALSGAMPTLPVETKLPSIFSAGFSQANVALYIVPSLVTTKNSQLPLSLALLNHKVSSVLGSNATHLPSFSLAISLTSPILRDTWSSLSINLYSTQVLPSCGPSPPVASHVAVLIALSQSKVAVYTLPSVVFTSYSQLPVAFSTLNHRVASVLAVRSFHSPSPTFTLMQSTLSLAKEMSSSPATSLYSAQILPAASPALSGAMPTLPVETKLPSIFSAGFSQANVALYIVPSLVTTKNSQLPLSLALLNHKVSSVLGSNATHLPSFSLAISLTSPILRDTWSSLSINLYSTQVLPSCGPSPPVASHVAVLIALSQSKVAVYTLPSVVFTSYSQLPVAFSTLNHRVASVLAVRSFHSPSPTFTLMQSTLSLAKEMSSSPATSLYSAQILPAASPALSGAMPTLPVETKLPSIFSAGFSQANVALYIVPSLVTTKNSQLPLSLALLNHKVSSVLGSNATHLPSFSLAISLTSPILRDTWSSLSINLYSTQVLPSCGPSPPVASHVAVLIALSQSKVAVYTLPSVVFTSYSQLPVAFSTLNHRVASVLAVRSFHSPSPTFTLMQSTLSLAKEMSSSPATSLYSAQILPAASPALSGAMPTLPVGLNSASIVSSAL